MVKGNRNWYNIKYELADLIIPKLEAYRQGYINEGISIPNWLLNLEKESFSPKEEMELKRRWIAELDKMILAFKQISNYATLEDSKLGYDESVIQEGLDSFGKYFQHFWD